MLLIFVLIHLKFTQACFWNAIIRRTHKSGDIRKKMTNSNPIPTFFKATEFFPEIL